MVTAPTNAVKPMVSATASTHAVIKASRATTFYRTEEAFAEAGSAASVSVKLSIGQRQSDRDAVREMTRKIATASVARGDSRFAMPKLTAAVRKAVGESLKKLIESRFEAEFEKMVAAYRAMLHESLAKGEDKVLQAALNKARLQEKVLACTSMADQAQACELLGLSTTNPSATLRRREDKHELLRFTVDGRAAYPLFQFDIEERRVKPIIARLIEAKPADWSNFRLLHWLTRPHTEFDGSPATVLGKDDEAVTAAFLRESMPIMHG